MQDTVPKASLREILDVWVWERRSDERRVTRDKRLDAVPKASLREILDVWVCGSGFGCGLFSYSL
jgi:hypothetical protein